MEVTVYRSNGNSYLRLKCPFCGKPQKTKYSDKVINDRIEVKTRLKCKCGADCDMSFFANALIIDDPNCELKVHLTERII